MSWYTKDGHNYGIAFSDCSGLRKEIERIKQITIKSDRFSMTNSAGETVMTTDDDGCLIKSEHIGDVMDNKRKDVLVKVFVHDDLNCELPECPEEFIEWWQNKFDLVPDEYRDTAKIELEGICAWDYGVLEATVSYSRPETDDEMVERMIIEERHERDMMNRELVELERLKRKYEN